MFHPRQFLFEGLLIAVLSGLIMQGSFPHFLIGIGLGIYVVLPICLILGVTVLFRKKPESSLPMKLLKMSACVIPLIILSLLIGVGVNTWRKNSVENYVETAVPVLDAYKARTGSFPKSLAEAGLPPPPEWLTNGYDGDTSTFRFKYDDPAEMMGGYYFESIERRWNHWS